MSHRGREPAGKTSCPARCIQRGTASIALRRACAYHAHMEPTHDSAARKRPVNLTLNADLVDRVRSTTDNLSAVVERLLVDYLEQRRQSRLEQHRISDAACAAWNAFNDAHGSIADEYSSL